jgi:hypothetical protein
MRLPVLLAPLLSSILAASACEASEYDYGAFVTHVASDGRTACVVSFNGTSAWEC